MDTPTNTISTNNSDKISVKELIQELRDWYKYILSKWAVILILSAIGAALGLTYSFVKNPQYKATTKFVLEEEGQSSILGDLGGLVSIAGIDIGNDKGLFQGENLIELYRSRNMVTNALLTEVENDGKKMLLIDQYIDHNNLREDWEKTSKLKGIKFISSPRSRTQDSIIEVLVKDINKKNLKVFKSSLSNIMSVEVTANDEFFAKAFNEALVENVNKFYIQTKTRKTLENLDILQKKSDSVQNIMNRAIYSAAIAVDATPNINPARQAQRVVPVQRSQFTAQTNEAILSELIKNLELTKMKLMKETPLIQIIDSPIYPLEKEKPGKLKCIIIGGFLVGFLTLVVLILKRIFQKIVTD
jgi:uncharacterized protein involved in exopolysaccharide biosynthesis